MASTFLRAGQRKTLLITEKLFATHANPLFLHQWPKKVTVVEVGPRDGLQNEPKNIPTATKINLINKLLDAGVRNLEATSFVSPKWVPQMADHKEVMMGLEKKDDVNYIALVPNLRGLEKALSCGVKIIAVFVAASETFSQKNINCSIEESLLKAEQVMEIARDKGTLVRGYVSCVSGCPYEGQTDPKKVAELAKRLYDMKCYEVALGDTIGVGTPGSVSKMLEEVLNVVPADKVAVHFHDTYGQALANIVTALQMGVSVVDSAVGGLGGCPYAKGASGNVATEDLVYMLNGMGIDTGIDLNKIVSISHYICQKLDKQVQSRVGRALPRLS